MLHQRILSLQYVRLLPAILLILLFAACGPRASSIRGNTEGYDLEHPMRFDLPTALNEISGLWYYPKDTSLFAIVDEDGFLYKIFPRHTDRILRWKFGTLGDYEDVVLLDNTFFILRSDGALFATNIMTGDSIRSVKYDPPERGDEYESLFYDKTSGMLVLVCKACKKDNKKTLNTLAFDPVTRQYLPAPFILNAGHIAGIIGDTKLKFKPSAATVNPFTGQLMIVSAINSLLVIAQLDGSVLQAYPLNKKIYKQPEGIAVGADRTLYISNEWAEKGSANILVMPHKAKKK